MEGNEIYKFDDKNEQVCKSDIDGGFIFKHPHLHSYEKVGIEIIMTPTRKIEICDKYFWI